MDTMLDVKGFSITREDDKLNDFESNESESEESNKGESPGQPTKTPVSVLQELCIRNGLAPKYDLLQVEGAIHEPVFKYRVTVGDSVATGCGNSKKKAKHSTAKAMLAKFKSSGQPQIVFAPYDDDIKGNPIGRLQEMCMARRMPPPTYGSHHEEGEPHQKSFSVHCNIEGKFKETGTGKNKKMAKRQAAYKIIIKLSELPEKKEDSFEHDDDELAQNHNLDFSELEEAELKNQTPSKRVSRFHKNLQFFKGKQISMLRQGQLETAAELNCAGTLEEVASEQHFEVKYVDVEEISKTGLYQCMVQLSTKPMALCFGRGMNRDLAKQDAAKDALNYIKLMIK